MGRTVAPTKFASWLNEELARRNWGVRTLAKKINHTQPEIARRALNRYLFEGAQPTEAYRAAIAAAFGIAEDEVPDGDDEEPG